jgi:hypothetical protein
MKSLLPVGIAIVALSASAGAQDSTVKSQTKIKADDGQVMTLTGCLRRDPAAGGYTLFGTAVAGDELTTDTKVSTDVDRDGTKVSTKSRTKGGDQAAMSTFVVIPRDNIDLDSQVGHQVQLSTVSVERGHGDADVKVKEKTTTDPKNGRDTTSRSTTKIEVPRGPAGQYAVIGLRSLADTCTAR